MTSVSSLRIYLYNRVFSASLIQLTVERLGLRLQVCLNVTQFSICLDFRFVVYFVV